MSEPDRDALRIGTAERDEAVRLLGEHFQAGRLDVDEYDTRLASAMSAMNRAHLRPLFADLPVPHPPFMAPPMWAAPPPMPSYPPPQPRTAQYQHPQPMSYQPPQPMQFPPQQAMQFYGHPTYSEKSRVVAGVLQILLPFGIGRFYTGHYGLAFAQLITCGGFGLWCWIDGLILLINGGTDSYGNRLRD